MKVILLFRIVLPYQFLCFRGPIGLMNRLHSPSGYELLRWFIETGISYNTQIHCLLFPSGTHLCCWWVADARVLQECYESCWCLNTVVNIEWKQLVASMLQSNCCALLLYVPTLIFWEYGTYFLEKMVLREHSLDISLLALFSNEYVQ